MGSTSCFSEAEEMWPWEAHAFDQPFVVMVRELWTGGLFPRTVAKTAAPCGREPTGKGEKKERAQRQSHLEQQLIDLYNAANLL